jgi:hypothetical protein
MKKYCREVEYIIDVRPTEKILSREYLPQGLLKPIQDLPYKVKQINAHDNKYKCVYVLEGVEDRMFSPGWFHINYNVDKILEETDF